MSQLVTLIPGDSVGPEVAKATCRLVDAAGADIQWEHADAGRVAFLERGDAMPEATIASIRRHGVALKGRFATPEGEGYESPNVRLRKALDLFAGVRPIRHLPGLSSRYQDVDLVIVRECTEDVYAGIEHRVYPGVALALKVTTRAACERIVRFAFDYARMHGRQRVTLVHKANIMKKSDGLFLRVGQEVSEAYGDITFDALIADNTCMQLVRDPRTFDVLVCQNLFGDLLSDLGAGLVGGIGAVWGVLRGADDIHVFEAIHGIATDIEGKGIANPLPFICPALAMLRHMGQVDPVVRIERALAQTLEDGVRTADLGGQATTEGFVDAVIGHFD
jgi:isocitrate dehydrogenase (NAD+)